MEQVQTYDLAVAWNWEYDDDFISLINEVAKSNNISFLEIRNDNLKDIYDSLINGKIRICYFLDRASDEDESFIPIKNFLFDSSHSIDDDKETFFINSPDLLSFATDKATMHLEFLSCGIEVPYTIIISPFNYEQEIKLSISELAKLGRPFIIKPANITGGGIGVVKGAESLKEIFEARQFHKNDKYLLQETIKPIEIAGRRAWFRVFYAFDEIIPCWWNDITYVYIELSREEEENLNLGQLRMITKRIRDICKLDFFSTELVYTEDDRCVAVDYVNEICDMRLQSKHFDGVPDEVVLKIVNSMINYVSINRKK